MPERPLAVLKFGSSVLRSEEAIPLAVHEIFRHLRLGYRIVAVVSALGKATDRLLALAGGLGDSPPAAPLASLLATGETASAALLAIALDRSGIPATLLEAPRLRLRTWGARLDSEPCDLDRGELLRVLEQCPVAVVGGFVGQDMDGGTSLLGRGGSDLTAIFVAHQLRAPLCRLLKDVDGVYRRDPAAAGPLERFAAIAWQEAPRLAAGVVQAKALDYAWRRRVAFEVSAPGAAVATAVGEQPTRLAPPHAAAAPLRVALLGLGTVGLGVYRHLAADPERFAVVGIAVRDKQKHRDDGVPAALLSTDPGAVVALPGDLVIEAIGGEHPAAGLVAGALAGGRDVITANKAVVARHGPRLGHAAAGGGPQLRFSATVGGGVPVLETIAFVARAVPVRSVTGILNATTTFILDQLAAGSERGEAIRLAQQRGFAEADPTCDLDGTDAAHKLVIVARTALGVELDLERLAVRGIDRLAPEEIAAARRDAAELRLVAACARGPHGVTAEVRPLVLPRDHPLAGTHGEENRALVEGADGSRTLVSGKGAGRWPTAESVLADALDLYRLRRAAPPSPLALDDLALAAPAAAQPPKP